MEWLTIPASLVCFINRGKTEAANSSRICVWCSCIYVVLCLCSDYFCGPTENGFVYMCLRGLGQLRCAFAYDIV